MSVLCGHAPGLSDEVLRWIIEPFHPYWIFSLCVGSYKGTGSTERCALISMLYAMLVKLCFLKLLFNIV